MTDIVERLRAKGLPPPEILQEAADTIEDLRFAVFTLDEINDRLRTALQETARQGGAEDTLAAIARRALEPMP